MKKPRSEEWKRKQSEGIKRAIAQGKMRVAPEVKAAQVKRMTEANKGKKRAPEIVEKIRLANTGKKRSVEAVEAMRLRVIQGLAEGKYKCKDLAARGKRISEARKGIGKGVSNPQHSQRMSGYKWSVDAIKARQAANTGKVRDKEKTPHAAKGPQNQAAVTCEIRSPENVVYFVRNITDWVRRHPHLFSPQDVAWRKRPGRTATCRAMKGIMKLRESRDPRGSWKGWTLVSDIETYFNGGNDLLARDCDDCPNSDYTTPIRILK